MQRCTAELHSCVHYVPDSVDRRHFRLSKPLNDFNRRPLRAIWSGAPNKVDELLPILPLLHERKIPLTVITSADHLPAFTRRALSLVRIPYRFVPWRYASFPQRILDGEICLVYRSVDNTYNQGHSFYKIAVFMAQGVPVLASPVPSYAEVIRDGENGRIVAENGVEAWGAEIDEINADRTRLVEWSQRSVAAIEPYATQQVVEQYVQLFQTVCG